MMAAGSRGAARDFDELVRDVAACRACDRMAHTHALTGANGPTRARVLFVAEAVGRRGGARTGVPLTRDEAGKRFERFLAIAGIDRADAFITNAVLCNPLDAAGRNRSPAASETGACRPFLRRTIELVRAPVVVALGRVALESLRAIEPHGVSLPDGALGAARWRGRQLVALFHPGRQSTLHRAEAAQIGDWRELGEIVRACGRRRLAPAAHAFG